MHQLRRTVHKAYVRGIMFVWAQRSWDFPLCGVMGSSREEIGYTCGYLVGQGIKWVQTVWAAEGTRLRPLWLTYAAVSIAAIPTDSQ